MTSEEQAEQSRRQHKTVSRWFVVTVILVVLQLACLGGLGLAVHRYSILADRAHQTTQSLRQACARGNLQRDVMAWLVEQRIGDAKAVAESDAEKVLRARFVKAYGEALMKQEQLVIDLFPARGDKYLVDCIAANPER